MQMDTKQQDTAGMRHRIVDIYEYMPVLIDILQSGKEVNLTVTGSSMAPFLGHLRDTSFHRSQSRFSAVTWCFFSAAAVLM